jgi:hypothetical protein
MAIKSVFKTFKPMDGHNANELICIDKDFAEKAELRKLGVRLWDYDEADPSVQFNVAEVKEVKEIRYITLTEDELAAAVNKPHKLDGLTYDDVSKESLTRLCRDRKIEFDPTWSKAQIITILG